MGKMSGRLSMACLLKFSCTAISNRVTVADRVNENPSWQTCSPGSCCFYPECWFWAPRVESYTTQYTDQSFFSHNLLISDWEIIPTCDGVLTDLTPVMTGLSLLADYGSHLC